EEGYPGTLEPEKDDKPEKRSKVARQTRKSVCLLDAPRLRAAVVGLEIDGHPMRVEQYRELVDDLLRHPLLKGEPPSVHPDDARDLRVADDLVLSQISDQGVTNECFRTTAPLHQPTHVLGSRHGPAANASASMVYQPVRSRPRLCSTRQSYEPG